MTKQICIETPMGMLWINWPDYKVIRKQAQRHNMKFKDFVFKILLEK